MDMIFSNPYQIIKVNNKSTKRMKFISLRRNLGLLVVYTLGGMTVNRPNNATIEAAPNIDSENKKSASKIFTSSIFCIRKPQVKKTPTISASTIEIAKIADRNVIKRNTKTSAPKIDIPNSIINSAKVRDLHVLDFQRAGRRSPLMATRNSFRSWG